VTQQFTIFLTDKMTTPDKEVVRKLKELKANKKTKDTIETPQASSAKTVEEGKGNVRQPSRTPK